MALFILGLMLLLKCILLPYKGLDDSSGVPDHAVKECDELEIVVETGHFVGRVEGKRRWEFKTDKVLVSHDDNRIDLDNVYHGIFYDEDKDWLYFFAERAQVSPDMDNLNMENVTFESVSGDILTANTVLWKKDQDKVVLEGDVCILQKKGALLRCDKAKYTPGDNILETIGKTIFEIEAKDN